MIDVITYKLKSDYSNLEELRDFIISKSMKYGLDNDNAYLVSLAVDEACTNLIRYAYKFDNTKEIELSIEKEDNKLILKVKDSGKAFNPLEVQPPDMTKYFNEFKRGGLGIFIMRKVMDEIYYTPANDHSSKNTLTLIKYI